MSQDDKKDARASHASEGATESAEGKGRPGMPNKASVLSEKAFTSPKGKHYRIIRTDEMDPYDAPVSHKEQRGRQDSNLRPSDS
jgi:hypothetical protein